MQIISKILLSKKKEPLLFGNKNFLSKVVLSHRKNNLRQVLSNSSTLNIKKTNFFFCNAYLYKKHYLIIFIFKSLLSFFYTVN